MGPTNRIPAIDSLRGLVMILMTLDHVRDFFSNAGFDPTDLSKTSAALFLTRWITHFCAPVFIFLAGTSAYLSGGHIGKNSLSRFLLTRGLWLTFLGVSFESLVWSFWPELNTISGSVLWAIGWSMICLAGLVYLPMPVIVGFGLAMMAGHNVFDGISQRDAGAFGPLWAILHSGEIIQINDRLRFEPYYPLIPWLGVMAAGYGFGCLIALAKPGRDRKLYLLGCALILLFIGIRYTNVYGDPRPWTGQDSAVFTLFSFLNCDKYPPSLCYLLMTLGPAIALLPLMGRVTGRCAEILQIFGQTPMFFYLLHLPLIISLSLVNALAVTLSQSSAVSSFAQGFPQAYGYALPVVYLVWIAVLLILYPLCRWFRELKRSKAYAILRYF